MILCVDALWHFSGSLEEARAVVGATGKFSEYLAGVNEYLLPTVESDKHRTALAYLLFESHETSRTQRGRQDLVLFVGHSERRHYLTLSRSFGRRLGSRLRLRSRDSGLLRCSPSASL